MVDELDAVLEYDAVLSVLPRRSAETSTGSASAGVLKVRSIGDELGALAVEVVVLQFMVLVQIVRMKESSAAVDCRDRPAAESAKLCASGTSGMRHDSSGQMIRPG